MTYLGPARCTVHAAHVIEAHYIYNSKCETHERADEREQCSRACQGITLRVLDLEQGQDSSASQVSDRASSTKQKVTHERSNADSTLSVFHSLTSEATKLSHESLNLAKEGETFGGTQSSGNGKTVPVVRYCAFSDPAVSHASIIR